MLYHGRLLAQSCNVFLGSLLLDMKNSSRPLQKQIQERYQKCKWSQKNSTCCRVFYQKYSYIAGVARGMFRYSAAHKKRTAYNKTLCKWGEFERAKTTLKMLLASWFLMCFFKRFRFLIAKNLESVGPGGSKGCKVTSHQTLRMIWPRRASNPCLLYTSPSPRD